MTKRVLFPMTAAAGVVVAGGVFQHQTPSAELPTWLPAAAIVVFGVWAAFVAARAWAVRQWTKADLASTTAWLAQLRASWVPSAPQPLTDGALVVDAGEPYEQPAMFDVDEQGTSGAAVADEQSTEHVRMGADVKTAEQVAV